MHRLLVVTILFFLFSPHLHAQKKQNDGTPLHVMSFNIRYGSAADGNNHWNKRRQVVAEAIKKSAPDIVGTQETLDFQALFLSQQLPEYTYVGRSRQVNPAKGEQCGIFFRTSRFDKLVEGHFWLSQTPDKPGSKSWDSSLPRMATWLKLWDRTTQNSFYVINTHFDHRGQIARAESAKLIRQFVSQIPDAQHVVVTGDFNAAESSAPYKALFGSVDNKNSPLRDSFRVINNIRGKNEGTFGGFKGTADGARIDWVGVSAGFQIDSAKINRIEFDGRYPSDHYPVHAVLSFGRANQAAKKD